MNNIPFFIGTYLKIKQNLIKNNQNDQFTNENYQKIYERNKINLPSDEVFIQSSFCILLF